MEFVNFLKNPQQYTELGAKIPKGAILTGKQFSHYVMLYNNFRVEKGFSARVFLQGQVKVPFVRLSVYVVTTDPHFRGMGSQEYASV